MQAGEDLAIVRQFGRNVAHRTDDEIQLAIDAAGSEFARRTKWAKGSVTLAFAAGENSLGGLPADFRPDLLLGVSAGNVVLELVDYPSLLAARDQHDWADEVTTAAVSDAGTIELWPTPNAAGTLLVRYALPWGVGVWSLPDDLYRELLIRGAAAYLQQPDLEAPYVAQARADFEAFIRQCAGPSTPVRQTMAGDPRRRPWLPRRPRPRLGPLYGV